MLPLVAALLVASGWLPAASAQTLDDWKPGPFASGEPSYAGNLDEPATNTTLYTVSPYNTFTVRGWVVDKTAQSWTGIMEVHVYDGLPWEGGVFLGDAALQQSRPDVSAAFGYLNWEQSGFWVVVPTSKLRVGTRSLTVFARTADKGWWYRQTTVNVLDLPIYPSEPVLFVERPDIGERIKAGVDYTINGYALDRNALTGTGVDRVEVYMDGPKTDPRTTFVGAARLGRDSTRAMGAYDPQFGNSGWELTISPGKYTSTTHQMFVYARSSVSGKETMLDRQITIYD